MAIVSVFCILHGRIAANVDNGDLGEWGNYGETTKDQKSYRSNGWEVKIIDPRGKRPGKIVCRIRHNCEGNVITRKKECELADGALIIEAQDFTDGRCYPSLEMFQLAQNVSFYPKDADENWRKICAGSSAASKPSGKLGLSLNDMTYINYVFETTGCSKVKLINSEIAAEVISNFLKQ